MAKMPPKASRSVRMVMKNLNEEQARRRSTSPFVGTGMHPNGLNGLDSDNFIPGVSGYRLAETPEFNDLKLRGEIIANDALVSPVIPAVANVVATNFALTASAWSTVVTIDATVPAGCTQLLAHATGMALVVNPNATGGNNGAGGDIIQARVCVGTTNGMTSAVSISGGNGQTSVSAVVAGLLTGLTPGSTVTLKTQAASGFQNFAANGTNQANVTATLLWLR